MAATIPNDRWVDILFHPKPTGCPPDEPNLQNMKFDSQHYKRYYTLCRGAGGSHDQCKDIPVDEHVTPQNPAMTAFQKEIFDGVECMNNHGDINKCLHHTEYVAKVFEWKAEEKGTLAKTRELLGRMGTAAWLIPGGLGLRWLLKL